MSYDSLVRLAEEFRLEKEVGLALRCLSAASQIQNLDNLQKADVNLNIGRLLLKYGKNKGPDEYKKDLIGVNYTKNHKYSQLDKTYYSFILILIRKNLKLFHVYVLIY